MSLSFDELESQERQENRNQKPLWTIDLNDPENEKNILKWCKQEVAELEDKARDRVRSAERNIAIYKGYQYESQDTRDSSRDTDESAVKPVKKIVANHAYDLTENLVSRQVKYRPAIAVMPGTGEHEDKVKAKQTKQWLDHVWYQLDFDGQVLPKVCRNAKITGEGYLFILWNKDKGEIHPDSKGKQGKKIPLLDENGAPKKDELGNPITIDEAVRIGEIDYKVILARDVFPQAKCDWSEVDYIFYKEIKNVEELRIDHKDKASKIKETENYQVYDLTRMEMRKLKGETVVYHLFHRHTKALDKGRYIKFTPDVILENTDLPFDDGELPFEVLPNIQIPGELHARSYLENIKGLTNAYNNLTNLILRNQILVSHPKWVMPAGSAKVDALGNDITIVQYKGPIAPQLIQSNPTPGEVFTFRDKLKEDFQQIAGVFGVSRGEPPKGVEAGIALQFLNEQENERHNADIVTYNDFLRRVARKTISRAAQYYDKSDGRMVKIMGKNSDYMADKFDPKVLDQDYDIRIQNSSAFPESKTARLNTLLYLNERFPMQVPPEQVLEMLDLAQSDKFVDAATRAVRAAECENELIMDGKEVAEPEEWEDLMTHWRMHVRPLQEYSFKTVTPPEIQEALKDHIMATEMLMVEKAKLNPAFGQMLMQMPEFPLLFMPSAPAQPPEMDLAPADKAKMEQSQMQSQQMPPQGGGGAGPIGQEPQIPTNPDLSPQTQDPSVVDPAPAMDPNQTM